MTRFAEDTYRPQSVSPDVDYLRVRAQLITATARLVASIRALDNGAWEHLTGQQPGYPHTASGTRVRITGGDTGYTIDTSVLDVDALDELHRLTDNAVTTLRATGLIYNVTMRWAARRARPVIPPDDPTDDCSSCIRIGVKKARHRGDLCEFCYRFQLTEQRLPPPAVLKIHHDPTRRLTQRDVAVALGKPRPGPPRKR